MFQRFEADRCAESMFVASSDNKNALMLGDIVEMMETVWLSFVRISNVFIFVKDCYQASQSGCSLKYLGSGQVYLLVPSNLAFSNVPRI